MDKRRARLLPRLITALDTLDNDGEIVATVRRLRGFLGPAAFSEAMLHPDDGVSLAHSDLAIRLKLRGTGLALRRAEHPTLAIDTAIHHVADALVDGGTVDRGDLLVTLACLRDLTVGESRFNDRSAGRIQSQLWDSMNELWGLTRR